MSYPEYEVMIANWREDHERLSQIRFAVFVREQGVPPELEIDPVDADVTRVVHAIATASDGSAIATGRLVLDGDIPRIGRMAVLRRWRSKGVGGQILEFLCGVAQQRGYPLIRLNAQTHATPFYYKRGFLSHGAEFTEAGIPHLEMRRTLAPLAKT